MLQRDVTTIVDQKERQVMKPAQAVQGSPAYDAFARHRVFGQKPSRLPLTEVEMK
jgi:hypothetical protein